MEYAIKVALACVKNVQRHQKYSDQAECYTRGIQRAHCGDLRKFLLGWQSFALGTARIACVGCFCGLF